MPRTTARSADARHRRATCSFRIAVPPEQRRQSRKRSDHAERPRRDPAVEREPAADHDSGRDAQKQVVRKVRSQIGSTSPSWRAEPSSRPQVHDRSGLGRRVDRGTGEPHHPVDSRRAVMLTRSEHHGDVDVVSRHGGERPHENGARARRDPRPQQHGPAVGDAIGEPREMGCRRRHVDEGRGAHGILHRRDLETARVDHGIRSTRRLGKRVSPARGRDVGGDAPGFRAARDADDGVPAGAQGVGGGRPDGSARAEDEDREVGHENSKRSVGVTVVARASGGQPEGWSC